MIENITPILRADDLAATKRYYLDVLGFAVNWEVPYMLSVVRDGHPLLICDGHQGRRGMWLWIGVEDADALHAEFVAKGAVIRDPPQSFEWGYEFQVEDPNGHVLRFASEPRPGPYDAPNSRPDGRPSLEKQGNPPHDHVYQTSLQNRLVDL